MLYNLIEPLKKFVRLHPLSPRYLLCFPYQCSLKRRPYLGHKSRCFTSITIQSDNDDPHPNLQPFQPATSLAKDRLTCLCALRFLINVVVWHVEDRVHNPSQESWFRRRAQHISPRSIPLRICYAIESDRVITSNKMYRLRSRDF